MTSLVSEKGPSVTVILPFERRTRAPSLLGNRPPVSTSVPFLNDSSTNLPIASIRAGGGGDSRYDSGWRMKVRYFMVPPWVLHLATNEPGVDRQAEDFFPLVRGMSLGLDGDRPRRSVPFRPWILRIRQLRPSRPAAHRVLRPCRGRPAPRARAAGAFRRPRASARGFPGRAGEVAARQGRRGTARWGEQPPSDRALERRGRCTARRASRLRSARRARRLDRAHRIAHLGLRPLPRNAARAEGGRDSMGRGAGAVVWQHP